MKKTSNHWENLSLTRDETLTFYTFKSMVISFTKTSLFSSGYLDGPYSFLTFCNIYEASTDEPSELHNP
jgi:hypothetical protein